LRKTIRSTGGWDTSVNAARVTPLLHYAKAVLDFHFYRRFLPGIAKVLRPLMDALHGDKFALDEVPWSPGMDAAFSSSKKALDSPLPHLTRFLELP
jgi:hypothetical protein